MDSTKGNTNPFRFPKSSCNGSGSPVPEKDLQRLCISEKDSRILSPSSMISCESPSLWDPSVTADSFSSQAGSSSSSATVNETKKMGKFKFLTIPSNPSVLDGGSSSPSTATIAEPTVPQLSVCQQRVLTAEEPAAAVAASTYESCSAASPQHSFTGSGSELSSGDDFGIPAPLPLIVQPIFKQPTARPRTQEEIFIEQQVKRLLKVTGTLNPIDNVEEDVEDEEDDDFDSRLDQMIAEEEENRKRGRKRTSVRGRGGAAAGGMARRKSTRKKGGKEEANVAQSPPKSESTAVPETRSLSPPKLDTVVKVKGKRGRKKKVQPLVETAEATSTIPNVEPSVKEPESEDTSSQFSETVKDGEESGDLQPLKPKSRWVEKACSYSGPGISGQVEQQEPDSTTSVQSMEKLDEDAIVDESLVPSGYDDIVDCVRLSRHRAKDDREARKMRCDCQYSQEEADRGIKGCTEGCLNRMLYIECGPKCAARDYCSNKRFQRKEYAAVEVFKTKLKGWGIRAKAPLPAGVFICEYVGEVLDQRQFKKRQKEYNSEGIMHHYFMALNNDEVIDATRKGNFTRFTNHSCDPNSETQKWTVGGQLRIGFFTIRPVSAGEELTFDYQFERYGKKAQRCYCGTSLCRGFIGSVDDKKKANKGEITDSKMVSEIDKFVQQGSIKTADQALRMARLLLRVDEDPDRMTLLRVLQNSERNTEALKAFLRCQGLTILADMMYFCRDSSPEVRLEILQTLPILPIATKNSLVDSNVWSTLEKWCGKEPSKDLTVPTSSQLDSNQENIPMKVERTDESAATATPNVGSNISAATGNNDIPVDKFNAVNEESAVGDLKQGLVKDEEDDTSQDASEAPVEKGVNPEDEEMVRTLAANLLESWEGLKMVYKIPKKLPLPDAEPLLDEAKKSLPIKSLSGGTTIPTIVQGVSRPRNRSPSPSVNGYFPTYKRPKFMNYRNDRRFDFQDRRFAPSIPAGVYFPDGELKEPAVPTEDLEAINAAIELMKQNIALTAHQVSNRLLHNKVPTGQKVTVLLPDGSVHDARTFKPTDEQAVLIRNNLPEVGSELWEEKAKAITSRVGLDVSPIDAPVVNEIVGWTSNITLTGEVFIPQDWAAAYDRVGRLYFYHVLTGVSRWDLPDESRLYTAALQQLSSTVSIPQDIMDFTLIAESALDLPQSPEDDTCEAVVPPAEKHSSHKPHRPPSSSMSSRAKKEKMKKRRVEFQNELCQYILQVLNTYRTPQCNQGRIESKEDFKYLARKFTHTVLEQEVKRHRDNPDALKFSSKHKPKIKEYVRRYMTRFGKVYKREGINDEEDDEEEEGDSEHDGDEEETPEDAQKTPAAFVQAAQPETEENQASNENNTASDKSFEQPDS